LDGRPDGVAGDTLHASYLHVHWAGHPALAQAFADAVHGYDAVRSGRLSAEVGQAPRSPQLPSDMSAGSEPRVPAPARGSTAGREQYDVDLHHHGDREVGEGLVDLAVNVRVRTPPAWLVRVIEDCTRDLAAYPDPAPARLAIARAHGLDVHQALPTAGAAEAFTLLARAARPRRAVVVHPQFTEPEAALRTAGHRVQRVILAAADAFGWRPGAVPDEADLVMVGNPTNPTSTLHRADTLRALLRPGRLVCVDEAFMDAVPGEIESLIGGGMRGLLVIRSLTKTWGLAGLRAGYVVGDPDWISRLAAQQPAWSVSTPALAAIEACLAPDARRRAQQAALEVVERRSELAQALSEVGLPVSGDPQGPYVLVDTQAWRRDQPPGWVRQALRERGFAVRRGDTFPGLGADWIRVAVRDAETTRALTGALRLLQDCR
jgi:cobyrinic acid a,c-diamide synthase